MDITYDYAVALGEARSCLAALAALTTDVDASIRYDRPLLRLDLMHDDYPGCHPITGIRKELLDRSRRPHRTGSRRLGLELLVAEARYRDHEYD